MPRDFIPAIYVTPGAEYQTPTMDDNLYNMMPRALQNNEIGAHPRPRFNLNSPSPTPAASTARGRGVVSFGGEYDLYLDEDTYYYDGGSQDLTTTSGNGYAGNTGFNEEYTASFVQHSNSGVTNLVIVNAGHTSTNASAKHGNVWYQATAGAAPSSIDDADLPCNNGVSITRGGASLDGYFFVCDIDGKIHNSNLNDITAWTSTDFITAEREPDTGVYLGKHNDNLVYIGTRSIEFFYNAGNASESPLSRRQDIYYNIGCYHPNTIVEVGDVIYFVGVDHSGWSRIYALDKFQLIPLSNGRVEEDLRDFAGTGTYFDITDLDALQHSVWMTNTVFGDSEGLMLTVNSSISYYWHKDTGKFSAMAYGATMTYPGGVTFNSWVTTLPLMSFNQTAASSRGRYQFINGYVGAEGGATNAAMNDLSLSNEPDVFLQFPRWDAGTDKKKRIKWIRVIAAPQATPSSAVTPLPATIRWFDYDRVAASTPSAPDAFSTGRSVDLNVRGARLARCGTARERSFLIQFTAGAGALTVIKGLEIEYEIAE